MALTNTEERIGTWQPRPRELRNLDRVIIPLNSHRVDRVGYVMSSNGRSSDVNKVDTKDLANEGEAPGGSQVALNNFELGGVIAFSRLPNDLHIERTRDLKRGSNLGRDLLQAGHIALI